MITSHYKQRNGYTILELVVVLGITGLLIATAIGGYVRFRKEGQVGVIVKIFQEAKSATGLFQQSYGGILPITESSTSGAIATSGSTLSGVGVDVLSKAVTFDQILTTTRCLDAKFVLSVGDNKAATGSVCPVWSISGAAFEGAAVPDLDCSQCNRIENVRLTNEDPLSAAIFGSSFSLDGRELLPAGGVATVMYIPNYPASLAYKVSLAIDGPSLSSSATEGDGKGSVIYTAPDASGKTTLVLHVNDL